MEDKFLMESLNSLLKDDLFKILAKFNIKLAKNTVKGKLVEKIVEIYEVENKSFLDIFSKDTIVFLSQLDEENNKVSEKDFYEFEEFLIPLQSFGFISKNIIKEKDNNHYLVSPWFIKTAKTLFENEENKKVIDYNQELEMLTLGMIRFYGVISENQLLELLSKTFTNISLEDLHNFVDKRWILNIFIAKIADESTGTIYFIADSVGEPVEILEEMAKYPELDYKVLSNEEYKSYWNYFFIEKTQDVADLIALLMKHKLQGAQIGFEITSIIDKIKNNKTTEEIVNDFNERVEFDSLNSSKAFVAIVTNIANTLPLWSLKGFSRSETSNEVKTPSVTRTVNKIGRNEPCTCGSGKKYKKCCGK
nr:SEC-C metal-binding domain-containing protein [uncultured Cetobacterium sp.]